MSVVSPTADVPFCQSMRYMKDHMSGVVGRSHCTSTLGGTGLVSLRLRGGPGQAAGESQRYRTVLQSENGFLLWNHDHTS